MDLPYVRAVAAFDIKYSSTIYSLPPNSSDLLCMDVHMHLMPFGHFKRQSAEVSHLNRRERTCTHQWQLLKGAEVGG